MKSFLGRLKRFCTGKLTKKDLSSLERLVYKPNFHAPFGDKLVMDPDNYRWVRESAKAFKSPNIDAFEKKRGLAIDQEWMHNLALKTQVVAKSNDMVPKYQHGRMLYSTLRAYISRHKLDHVNVLETGSARGFSSLCMAKALSDHEVCGNIVTNDVLPHNKRIYWNCIEDHLKGKQTQGELLSDYRQLLDRYLVFLQGFWDQVLDKVGWSRVHFAFLDGGHQYHDVMGQFEFLKDKQQKGDVIVFDDYSTNAFPGVVRAADEICEEYNYDKAVISEGHACAIATKN